MRTTRRSRRNGRRLLSVAAFAFAASAVAIACGFPDVRFGVVDDVDETTPEAGVDGAEIDAPPDVIGANLDAPGDEVEAGVRQDGQAKVDADAPCPGNPCDCDNDGYEGDGDGCSGDDCDDRDPLVHPNQTYIAEPPEPPNEGNWDCTDPIEKQYVYNLSCGAVGGAGAEGFRNDPGCGVVADFYRCTGLLFGFEKVGTRRQGCR